MKIVITTKQLPALREKTKMRLVVNESQYKFLKKKKIVEDVELYPFVSEIDENTTEVKLIDFNDKNIIIIKQGSHNPNEPSIEDLFGKKRGDTIVLKIGEEEKKYTIINIVSKVTKNVHQNFDEVKSIDELILKLKSDPFFQKNSYAPSKKTFTILEKLRNRSGLEEKRIMQIFYLLFRRAGSIKKFETKLNMFVPFMELLLDKGDQMFECLTQNLETALDKTDDKILANFSKTKKNYEDLYSVIKKMKSCQDVKPSDFESFFKLPEYSKYETSFVGDHFMFAPTSVSIDIKITDGLNQFDTVTFNDSPNLYKMLMILSWILKSSEDIKDLELNTKKLVDKLDIKFPESIKRDLLVLSPIFGSDEINKEVKILDISDNVEVKYKKYNTPDFLCEFFKPESHTASMEYLVIELSKVNSSINSSVEVLKLISILNKNIVEKIKDSAEGKDLIDSLKKETAGIIFNDYIFIKMEDINLEWSDKGYGSNPRIAIRYSVKETAKKYKLIIDKNEKNQIDKISWIE